MNIELRIDILYFSIPWKRFFYDHLILSIHFFKNFVSKIVSLFFVVFFIENAERFGLSQLHQLRGRVGRGADQSYCILMAGDKLSHESKQRLNAMVSTNDGFEIANIDLRLRGPGDIQGTRQSGVLDFKLADLIHDEKLVGFTRKLAKELLENDPNLQNPENKPILEHLKILMSKNSIWGKIS
jgi:ATP-dependent DNA helicase RecG